uniref:Uncharacterized protein n=1 Tax=Globodera rostochiensis TaxID=31243 RepID=A0A914HKX8_GLORO
MVRVNPRAPNTCAFYLRLDMWKQKSSTACAYRAILRAQTCVLNGPRQPARAQHVRVLSAAGYVETDAPNSMRLSCNSKNPNMRAEWPASTRACPYTCAFYLRLDMWKKKSSTACAYRAILRTQTCVLNGPRQPARAQHVRVLSAAGYVETDAPNSMRLSCNSKNPNVRGEWPASTRARPTPCAYRAILRTQTCVLNGPRQPARAQHVRVLSAAGYVETEVLNSMRLSCNSKSPNVRAEWSASTRACPTRARFICGWICGNRSPQQHARAILRAQTCAEWSASTRALPNTCAFYLRGYVETEVLNSMRCAYRAILRAQTCVLNDPRQPARAQHVRVLSAAGYVETEVLNSMRLSCNSKNPNVRAEWSASTRACPTQPNVLNGPRQPARCPTCAFYLRLDMWKQKSSTACASCNSKSRAQTCVLNGPRQPARAQHVRVLSAAGYVESPQQCAYRAILRAQTCVLNGPRQRALPNTCAFYLRLDMWKQKSNSMRLSCNSKSPAQTCVLNGPRQPARAQHVRVLSAAGYVETEVLNSMRLSCNSKSPNVRAEWSASTRACPTRARFICGWICGNRSPQQHYRAILRAQTCAEWSASTRALPNTCAFYLRRYVETEEKSSTACAYRAILRAQTCVLNGPRQPARAQHVRVLSAAGYVETEVLNSMRLSCNSKNPNVRGEWPASTRARPTRSPTQTCVLNGPRQPARAQHVRVLSAAGYVETDAPNTLRAILRAQTCCAEWSASTRAPNTAQTCVLNGPRQRARPTRARFIFGWYLDWKQTPPTACAYRAILRAQTCVLNACAYRAILRTQTCVLNGPRQPARAQHVRVLSAAGYVETEVLNSMRLSCNSKNPNMRADRVNPRAAQHVRVLFYLRLDMWKKKSSTACAYRAILRTQTCVVNGPRQPARAQHVAQTCVVNGPRQPARARAFYLRLDMWKQKSPTACAYRNSKSPNVRAEWSRVNPRAPNVRVLSSAGLGIWKQTPPTACAYRAILRTQTCVLNGPRQPRPTQPKRRAEWSGVNAHAKTAQRVRAEWSVNTARAQHVPFSCAWIFTKGPHSMRLSCSLRAQTCVLNGRHNPRAPKHVRVYLRLDM